MFKKIGTYSFLFSTVLTCANAGGFDDLINGLNDSKECRFTYSRSLLKTDIESGGRPFDLYSVTAVPKDNADILPKKFHVYVSKDEKEMATQTSVQFNFNSTIDNIDAFLDLARSKGIKAKAMPSTLESF